MPKLILHDLLIENVNSWGNVQYNIPMRVTQNETRTSTGLALRHIPDIYTAVNRGAEKPLPARVAGRDKTVLSEGYKTTSSEYCVKASYNKPNERSDSAMNCKNVIFMTGVERRLLGQNIRKPTVLSEMKDMYRGVMKPVAPRLVQSPDPEYIFDVVASDRNTAPVIPESATGFRRLLDPYFTTHRIAYKPYTIDEQYGLGAKDHITYYSESGFPKVHGFGPKLKEIWMPITATRKRGVQDTIPCIFKTEYKEISKRNTSNWLKGAFKTETGTKYTLPYASSELVTATHDEVFNLAPFQPNPYQTCMAPSMYCSEYCHISQGTPVNSVIDQLSKTRIQKPCVERYVVSRD